MKVVEEIGLMKQDGWIEPETMHSGVHSSHHTINTFLICMRLEVIGVIRQSLSLLVPWAHANETLSIT